MKTIKTSELAGDALDWAVCVANEETRKEWLSNPYSYSTNWLFGGPIIERYEIELAMSGISTWRAKTISLGRLYSATGPTPLIAAMRCYVASKLEDNVDIPDELVTNEGLA